MPLKNHNRGSCHHCFGFLPLSVFPALKDPNSGGSGKQLLRKHFKVAKKSNATVHRTERARAGVHLQWCDMCTTRHSATGLAVCGYSVVGPVA